MGHEMIFYMPSQVLGMLHVRGTFENEEVVATGIDKYLT